MFPEHVERSFLDPEYSFVTVRRILPTRFAKKSSPNQEPTRFAEYSQLGARTNIRPFKNGLMGVASAESAISTLIQQPSTVYTVKNGL